MTAVPQAMANQIADALVARLRTINAAQDASRWLTSPKQVKRGFVVADMQWPTPAILVQVARWDDQMTYAGREHTCRLTLFAHLLVNPDNPERSESELNSMAADVVRAISDDHSLDGTVNVVTAALGYEPNTDAMERSGLGVATMTLEATFLWSHGAP